MHARDLGTCISLDENGERRGERMEIKNGRNVHLLWPSISRSRIAK
jgi:hypothetical protein